MSELVEEATYLFSSAAPAPDMFLQGYCFVGADYIFGSAGGKEYFNERGLPIPPGQDGCYVSVEKIKDEFFFHNDHHGYKKIFYYSDGEDWVVSNSLYRISEEMRSLGKSVIPNYSQLSALSVPKQIFHHPFSFDTIIRNVKLVPSGFSLQVGEGKKAKLNKVKVVDRNENYEAALTQYLETWISRIETLLYDGDIKVVADITGGVDSRAVLALFLAARQRAGGKIIDDVEFRCGSIAGDQTDLQVASVLSKKFEFPLNQKSRMPGRHRYTQTEALDVWRDLSLGSYTPIYLPRFRPAWNVVQFGGGGGGVHRAVYDPAGRHNSLMNFFSHWGDYVEPKWLKPEFMDSVKQSFSLIFGDTDSVSYEDALIAHYRMFRNRFHAGRAPQYSVTFSPLGGKDLDSVSRKLGSSLKKSAQVNYDIISSLNQQLLFEKYDRKSKYPSQTAIQNLCSVKVSNKSAPGKIYADRTMPSPQRGPSSSDLFSELHDRLLKISNRTFVNQYWGEEYIKNAVKIANDAKQLGKFRHAVDGIPISSVMNAGIFFE